MLIELANNLQNPLAYILLEKNHIIFAFINFTVKCQTLSLSSLTIVIIGINKLFRKKFAMIEIQMLDIYKKKVFMWFIVEELFAIISNR